MPPEVPHIDEVEALGRQRRVTPLRILVVRVAAIDERVALLMSGSSLAIVWSTGSPDGTMIQTARGACRFFTRSSSEFSRPPNPRL
jgi:hypothetical protein